MRLSLLLALVISSFTLFAQQEKLNTLYLKTDNVPDRIVSVLPVSGQCKADTGGVFNLTFEGKLSEKHVRLSMIFKSSKKGSTKIKTDADGDLRSDQKVDVEIYGENPAVDKTTYSIEDEKDEAAISISKYDSRTGLLEGTMNVRYWDSAMNSRRLSANIRFSLLLN